MAIGCKEVTSVWSLKDMEFTTYEEGEDLIHEASYGLFVSYEDALRASKVLSKGDTNLPRGNWVINDEFVYGWE